MSSQLLDYLKQENQQLQEQVRELQGLLQLNKQALKVLMTQSAQSSEEQNKGLLIVLRNLQEENITLQQKIERLVRERNEAQSDQLINQQITEEAQRHERELIQSLQSKMSNLQENLTKTEEKLSKMEELKPEYDEIAGVVIKFREVCDPDLVVLKLHNEIQMFNEQLIIERKQQIKLAKEKSSLQGLNLVLLIFIQRLMSELLQLKSVAHGGNKFIFMNQDPTQLIDFQAQVIKSMKHSSSSSEQDSGSQEEEEEELSPKIQLHLGSNAKMKVIPKLDLTRAKQIQEINAKRQTQQPQKLNDIQSMERIQKLERALDELRKNHQREMILNRTLQAHNEELLRQCEEFEQRIKILTASNMRYQEKAKKINANYYFLLQFYQQYKDIVNTNSPSSHQKQASLMSEDQQFELDEMESPIVQEKQQTSVYYFVPNNSDESKKYLLQTAQQIYATIYERLNRVIEENPHCKHRYRSFSEIFMN